MALMTDEIASQNSMIRDSAQQQAPFQQTSSFKVLQKV